MRLRNIPYADQVIDEDPLTIQTDGRDSKEFKGKWNEIFFGNSNPIHIEIGMGKGKFITSLARMNPDINYIGIEKYSSVLVRAIEKRQEEEVGNLLFLRLDAEAIEEYFERDEVKRIYLNFSDPWPKDRHAKRRLTSRQFLGKYEKFLDENGEIEFKTDNRGLFDFSLEEAEEMGWEKDFVSFDLHANGPAEGNIMTEYEEKFYNKGNPICKMIIRKGKS